MPTVLHVVDGQEPDELRLALGPLLRRLPRETWRQVVVTGGRGVPGASLGPAARVHRLAGVSKPAAVEGAALARLAEREGADLLHAWSPERAHLAALARSECGAPPLLLSAWDPHLGPRHARRLQVIQGVGAATVLCHAEHVRRRYVERGLNLDQAVVVRPGIDFAALNRRRRDPAVGEALGLDGRQRVVLMPPSATPRCGHLFGLWVGTAAQYLMPELRLVIPGGSAEYDRVRRRAHKLPNGHCVSLTGRSLAFEVLLNWADALLVPAEDDVSTTLTAWAMAAGVPIVACATYASSELLADRVNSLLVKPGEPMAMSHKLLGLLRGTADPRRLADTARGQAFESFGLTRYVEQVRHAYDNLLAGVPAHTGMVDSALDV